MAQTTHGIGGLTFDPKKRTRPPELNVFIGLILIVAAFEALGWLLMGDSFLFNTRANATSIFNTARLSIIILQVSIVGIIAIGVTQVIILGGIDLSSGSVVGATAMIAMSFAQVSIVNGHPNPKMMLPEGWQDMWVIVPLTVGLACGLVAGLINGALIAYTRIPPFIATLGMMVTARGVAKWWSKGEPISFPTDSYAAIGKGMTPVFIFIGLAILFHLVLRYTVYGKHTYAIGSNEAAARMSGIKVDRHKVLVYSIAAILASVAAIVLSCEEPDGAGGHGDDVRARRHRDDGDRRRQPLGRPGLDHRHRARRADLRRHHLRLHLPEARRLLPGDGEGRDHRRRRGARPVAAAPRGGQRLREETMASDIQTNIEGADAPHSDARLGEVILKTEGLTKHYGGVHALIDCNFEIRKGEHVAIMGDNGAGKSTFVRQITAVEQRTAGKVWFNGRYVEFEGPLEAREAGIETVFQTLALADDLDVPDNLFLGREMIRFNLGPFSILDYKGMREATIAGLQKTGVKIPNINNTIQYMSGGQRQCVAIARTATFHSKLTIMDEPTAALGVQETAQVENIIRTLKEAGRAPDPDQPQHAPGDGPLRPHRGLAAGPDLRQPQERGDRRPGRRRLHHRRQDPGRIRRRGLNHRPLGSLSLKRTREA